MKISFPRNTKQKSVWNDLACRASYTYLRSWKGSQKLNISFIRVWPRNYFLDWINHPTLGACNSPYMQDHFKRLFVLCSSEMIFSFLIKKPKPKAIEIELAFFIPLGIPRVTRWIISFMLHKKPKPKAIEIELAFFHPLGYPKGHTLDYFFYASYIHHNFPYKLIPVSMSYLKYFWSYQWKQYKCI